MEKMYAIETTVYILDFIYKTFFSHYDMTT